MAARKGLEVGWAMGGIGPVNYVAKLDGREYLIGLEEPGQITLDGVPQDVDLQSIDGGFHYSLLVGATSLEVFVERCEDVCFVTIEDHRYQVQVEDERLRRTGRRAEAVVEAGEAQVTSPMPGLVVAVLVEEGQIVRTGEGLLILEAMKMENEIRAPRNGVVERVRVSPGQRVSQEEVLVRIGSPPA
jgi:biotin carboxyl carrier protein